jgi:hypothetical protein
MRAQLSLDRFEYAEDNAKFKAPTLIRRIRAEPRFHLPVGAPTESHPAESLVRALANAHDWLDSMLKGEAANHRDLSRRTGYDERYISHITPPAFLAAIVIESVLHGTQPIDWSLDGLIGSTVWCGISNLESSQSRDSLSIDDEMSV